VAVSRVPHLNLGQRIVLVIALAGVLYIVGSYVTSIGQRFGWVGYAPLSSQGYAPLTTGSFSGLHPWVRLVVWLGLTVIWAGCSVALLRSPSSD
jgi:heme/copper-type cytochrome/quinol oxidase subunit 1